MLYIMTEATLVEQAKGKELGYSVRPGKLKKQAGFGCFNGLCMLLLDNCFFYCFPQLINYGGMVK